MGHEDAILNERPIGVIIPPPETKKMIDKAAELVARYGSSVETTFKNDQTNLPKFTFLNVNDPYRPYYDQKINELIKLSNKDVNLNLNNTNNTNNQKDPNKFLGKKTDSSSQSNINPLNSRNNSIQNELRKMIEDKRLEKAQLNELKPPSQDQFSISHPNISSLDMDIIKATAQFVARNGQRFLTGLSEREMKNPQFDFLKPQHNLFGYFTYLVESYAKCLRKEDINKLTGYVNDGDALVKKATERYLWEKRSRENQKKKEIFDEEEKIQLAQIDWYDFAVVEVIEFTQEELLESVNVPLPEETEVGDVSATNAGHAEGGIAKFKHSVIINNEERDDIEIVNVNSNYAKHPNPITNLNSNYNVNVNMNTATSTISAAPNIEIDYTNSNINIDSNINLNTINTTTTASLKAKSKHQFENESDNITTKNNTNNINNTNNLNKITNPSETATTTSLPEPNMKIVKNYTRKNPTTIDNRKDTVKCPLCKEWISIDDWSMHIKIELLDPKWKEIQKEIQERKMEINLAPTGDFLGYLTDFSKYRPDLFGDVKDVVKIEEKKKIEAKAANTIWDGYAPNMTRTTANIAMLAQQTRKNIEETRKVDGQIPGQSQGQQSGFAIPIESKANISSNSRIPNINAIPISITHQSAQISNDNKGEINERGGLPSMHSDKKKLKTFKLNVKVPESDIYTNLSGQILSLQVNSNDLLSFTKVQILKLLSIRDSEADKFILKSFSNVMLEESMSVGDCELVNGSILELSFKGEGNNNEGNVAENIV